MSKVVILSPTEQKLKQTAKEIGCDYVVADVSNYESLVKATSEIVEKHKRIDCLINNAGLWIEGELDDNGPEKIKDIIEVNNLGVLYLSKAVIPQMKKQKSGLN